MRSSFAYVTGTASLNGTVDAVFAPGTYTQKQYVILMANVIHGTFAAVGTLPRLTLLTKFDGEFAPTARTYAGSGTLRYTW